MERARSASPRRRWVIVILFAALLGIVVAGWVGAHHVREPGPPRWTERDLPELVPSSENGVPLARAMPEYTASDAVRELARGDASPEDGWRIAVDAREEIETLVAPRRSALAAIEGRPHYRDDCRPSLTAVCEVIPLLRAQELAALALYADVAREPRDEPADAEAWARADAAAARLVERHRDLISAPRTILGVAVSVSLVSRVLRALRPLAHGARRAAASLPRLRAALEAPLAPLELRAPLVTEYLMFREGMAMVGGGLLFDAARTADEADAHFAALMDYADDDGAPRPALVVHTQGFAWFLYDPVGKALFDTANVDIARMMDELRARHRAAEAERAALLAAVEELSSESADSD